MSRKSNQKRRTVFNAVDAGILLVVLLLLLGTVYFIFFSDSFSADWSQSNGEERTVRYTLTLSGVDTDLLNENGHLPIVRGESLYHIERSFVLGRVETVGEMTDHMAATSQKDENGKLIYAVYPGKCDTVITVECTASYRDGQYFIAGKTLRVGESFTMATSYFTAQAYCSAFEEVVIHE